MEKKRNIVLRALAWLWGVVDGTRRVVVNAIFIIFVLIVLAALFGQASPPPQPKTALVIDPVGFVVEQYTSAPFDRAVNSAVGDEQPETRFRDLLTAIELGARDDNIALMVILPDTLWAIGPAQMHELRRAVARFKESGKPVYAYSEGMEQHQYFLAALADEIWMHPEGLVLMQGYGVFRNYYKDALDKLSVDVRLFRVGEYKSAGEPYVRNDMSSFSREANRYWLEDLWTAYVEAIAEQRSLSADHISDLANRYADKLRAAGGQAAKMAQEQGLVDVIDTRTAFDAFIAGVGAPNGHGSYRKIGFESYLRSQLPPSPLADQVAVVVAEGAITYGDQPPGTIGGESTVRQIRAARFEESVKAIVLRVDSPGGVVLPSEKIRAELDQARSDGKPVIVSMGTVAASGGYWISLGSDAILAESTTITGSIGIFGLVTNIPKTLARIGVHTDGVGTTPLSGAFRIDRPLPEEAANVIQQLIDDGYRSFIAAVAAGRELSEEAVDRVARGRVWSGKQAMERGLVDQLGGLGDAIALAAKRAGIDEDFAVTYYEDTPTAFEQWLLDISASAPLEGLRGALAPSWAAAWLTQLPEIPDELVDTLELTAKGPEIFSHCFCEISTKR